MYEQDDLTETRGAARSIISRWCQRANIARRCHGSHFSISNPKVWHQVDQCREDADMMYNSCFLHGHGACEDRFVEDLRMLYGYPLKCGADVSSTCGEIIHQTLCVCLSMMTYDQWARNITSLSVGSTMFRRCWVVSSVISSTRTSRSPETLSQLPVGGAYENVSV
jgi:hypothetical protein